MTRTTGLRIPLTPAELEAIREAAGAEGRTPTDLARRAILAALGVTPAADGRSRRATEPV